jgi:hypothetical protein
MHLAGPTENGWRVVNVVPSQQESEDFAREQLLLRAEAAAATCQRRRRPGQARRRQGWLQRLSLGAACRRHKENAGAAQSWGYGAHVGAADG